MSVVVIEPPEGLVVSLVEAKKHLRVDDVDNDDYIEALIKVATANLDGPDGFLGRSLLTQTLELKLNQFRHCPTPLPFGPVQNIWGVYYDDSDGVERTLNPSAYRLIGDALNASIVLAYNQAWPATRRQDEAVRIQYVTGYGMAADVPAPIKQAILLMIGNLYENREEVVVGQTTVRLPMAVDHLLSPYRIPVV
jgi:uncharacterized phiE125 gp8 family phage protein